MGYPAGEKGAPTQNIPVPPPQALGLLKQLAVLCHLRQHEDITKHESSPCCYVVIAVTLWASCDV